MVGVSVASEFEHAVQVLDDVALLHRMAEGTLMSRMSEGPPGSCWSTGAESCRACRSQSPHSCWESRAPLSRRGGRKACSSRRSSVCVTRSPWTMILASSAAY